MSESAGTPLAARELPALLIRVHAALAARRAAIDELNVFPVPDGDTGTNMTLTMRAGLDGLRSAGAGDARHAADAVIRGALQGARGNSGVILSQILRAVVEVVTGHARVDAALYAQALKRARELAYGAVAHPVEGTILTALSVAAQTAQDAVDRGHDLVAVSAQVCAATAAAVERTRDQLDVLRAAGVVDAGARGFEVLVAAVHGHLTGREPPLSDDLRRRRRAGDRPGTDRRPTGESFEVQYLLDADDVAADLLRARLEELGDSVAVVAAGGLLKVHVHTPSVGPVIEAGLGHGTPSSIEVADLRDQIAARARERTGRRPDTGDANGAIVAVAVLDGDGIVELAQSLGAVVVPGTAGALPSVADLVGAVTGVPADHVLLLPGHPNAVPTAEAAAKLVATEDGVSCEVVAPASSPPAVLAALAVMDRQAARSVVVADVTDAAESVRAGEVVPAVRDADTPIGPIRRGQQLAVVDSTVLAATDDAIAALERIAGALRAADAEVVTLLLGAGVTADERAAALDMLAGMTTADVEVVDAGHEPSRFWIGIE